MADNRDEFSEKVLAKLKEKNRAVDLTEEEIVAALEAKSGATKGPIKSYK